MSLLADCQVVSFVLYQPKVIENWHIFCDFHIYSTAPSYIGCTRLKSALNTLLSLAVAAYAMAKALNNSTNAVH